VYYDADRVLFVIANFLVYLFGECWGWDEYRKRGEIRGEYTGLKIGKNEKQHR